MNTTEPTAVAEKPAVKKPRKLKRYIVTLDGVPCSRVRDKRIGKNLTQLRGTLKKTPSEPEIFRGEKSANRAINFALRLRKKLCDSVCDITRTHGEYMAGTFKVEPIKPIEKGSDEFLAKAADWPPGSTKV
jgi:hypothetical protein